MFIFTIKKIISTLFKVKEQNLGLKKKQLPICPISTQLFKLTSIYSEALFQQMWEIVHLQMTKKIILIF